MSFLLQQRMLRGAAGTPFIITVGSNPALYGYAQPGVGSISPSASLRGNNIQGLYSPPASEFGYDLLLVISDVVVPQSYFKYLLLQPGPTTETLRHYATSAATYTTGGGAYSQWQWGDGSSRPWGSIDVGLTRVVTFQW